MEASARDRGVREVIEGRRGGGEGGGGGQRTSISQRLKIAWCAACRAQNPPERSA